MPFDYEEYQRKCDSLTTDQLQAEYENYTRQLAGGATSTATSVLFSPFTAGISLVGIGLSAPRVHNARKKREIIEAGLQARGETHRTRKRDVLAPVAVAGTLSGLTLGLAGPGADMIAGQVVGHGMEYAASHVALDATGAIVEHKHDKRTHQKAHQKLQTQYQYYQPPESIQSQVSLNQPGLTESPKPLVSPVLTPDPPPAYQLQPHEQKYGVVSPSSPQHSSIPCQPASHLESIVQVTTEPQSSMHQQGTYNLAQQPHTGLSPVSMPSELESPSVGTYLSKSQYSPTQSQFTPISDIQLPSTSDKLGPKSDGPLHVTVYELGTEPVMAIQGATSTPPQLTMEQEIAFLKAKILEMEIERREGANRGSTSPDLGYSKPTVQASIGQNDISQVQLGPFEPKVSITPALASLAEHQNFQPPPASQTYSVVSPHTISLEYPSEYQTVPPPSPPPSAEHVASPIPTSLEHPSDNQLTTTSLYPAPLRLRSHSAHIPGYQYPPPTSPISSVVFPITPTIHNHSENYAPTTLYIPPPPPPRPHSTHIPGYQYPPPSFPTPSVVSPITPSVQYSPDNYTSTTSYFPPPLPPRTHSAHIPEYKPSDPYSSASTSGSKQEQSYAAPPLPPRPQQQPPIQRQDSGYYSEPPSRHSSTFSTASSTCCSSPQSKLSPQLPGSSLLSPQTTGQSLRHSISYGSISPLSSQPTSYFPPPPLSPVARPLSQVKDYLSRPFARPSPQTLAYQPGINQPAQVSLQSQGPQGWQWGTAPMQTNRQPQYGAPPPIPKAWNGS